MKILIIAAVAFLVATFYFAGSAVTSYATYNKNLQEQLNSTNAALEDAQLENEQCESELAGSALSLSICNSGLNSTVYSLNTCNSDKSDLNNKISNLTSQVSQCQSIATASGENYKQLARSSAKPICCSFGDFQSGTLRNWNIANNSVVCTGSYTVNCSSGETNY